MDELNWLEKQNGRLKRNAKKLMEMSVVISTEQHAEMVADMMKNQAEYIRLMTAPPSPEEAEMQKQYPGMPRARVVRRVVAKKFE